MGSAVSTFLSAAGCNEKTNESDGEELTKTEKQEATVVEETSQLLNSTCSSVDHCQNTKDHTEFSNQVLIVVEQVEEPVESLHLTSPPFLIQEEIIEDNIISMATEGETLIPTQELPTSQEVAILDNSVDIQETEAPLSVPETTEDLLTDMAPTIEKIPTTKQNGKESGKIKNGGSVLKSKKKEDKDHILRALSSLETTEEKLAALCKKYADLHEEHRVLQSSFKQAQRRMSVISREKDQIQSEHTKAVMGKSKLESLCRELQKHNKLIKEESIQRSKEEDEKRKEISSKFQTTIGEIQQQMQENHDRHTKLREENSELAGKLKVFMEKYELQEEKLDKLMKHKEIEQQLAEAKLQQAQILLKQEQERGKQEKELLLQRTEESVKKSGILETQLGMYKDRYEDFQSTINKSNDMFQKFKTEMDKMSKRIKKLEKEGAQWKAKWHGCNKALLDMVEEKQKQDADKAKLQAKCSKLESLCRALQNELHGKKTIEAPISEPESSSTNDETVVNGTGDITPSSSSDVNPPPPSSTTKHITTPTDNQVTSTTDNTNPPPVNTDISSDNTETAPDTTATPPTNTDIPSDNTDMPSDNTATPPATTATPPDNTDTSSVTADSLPSVNTTSAADNAMNEVD